MQADSFEILAAGRTEAARMQAAVAGAAGDASVTMNAAQFAKLAALVQNLCAIADDRIAGEIGDPRYWVPLGAYVRLKREKDELAARSASFDLPQAGWIAAFDTPGTAGFSGSHQIM